MSPLRRRYGSVVKTRAKCRVQEGDQLWTVGWSRLTAHLSSAPAKQTVTRRTCPRNFTMYGPCIVECLLNVYWWTVHRLCYVLTCKLDRPLRILDLLIIKRCFLDLWLCLRLWYITKEGLTLGFLTWTAIDLSCIPLWWLPMLGNSSKIYLSLFSQTQSHYRSI